MAFVVGAFPIARAPRCCPAGAPPRCGLGVAQSAPPPRHTHDPYRVHDDNLNELRDDHRLRLSSVYATTLVGDGLAGGSGCVWVTSGNVASEVIRDYALLRSDTRPNLTVKVSDERPLGPIGSRSTYRLVTAADLLNEADTARRPGSHRPDTRHIDREPLAFIEAPPPARPSERARDVPIT